MVALCIALLFGIFYEYLSVSVGCIVHVQYKTSCKYNSIATICIYDKKKKKDGPKVEDEMEKNDLSTNCSTMCSTSFLLVAFRRRAVATLIESAAVE